MKIKIKLVTCLALFVLPRLMNAEAKNLDYKAVQKNAPVFRFGPIYCSASHYVWGGALQSENNSHETSIWKSINSSPLENKILVKKNKVMVDNEEFKIITDNKEETVAVYVDGHNVITIQILYPFGTIIYNKSFFNYGFGKNNFMSYVGECKNTTN